LVSRDKEKLQRIQRELKTDVKIVVADLSQEAKLKELYVLLKNDDIDMLVNNAGFGLFGEFSETDLSTEMDMINVNIRAVHVLTKLFLKDMIKKDSGYILNVSSSAGFQAGPLMATYYATKSYVTKLTLAIYEELRRSKSKVKVSCLCPGPVKTNFNDVANVKFAMKGMDSDKVAKYAIDKTLKGKTIIIPGFKMKMAIF
jgi:short-subunit dehydrogenase